MLLYLTELFVWDILKRNRGGGGMADALVSEASAARHEGSTPSSRTRKTWVRIIFHASRRLKNNPDPGFLAGCFAPIQERITVCLKRRLTGIIPPYYAEIINASAPMSITIAEKSPEDFFDIAVF